MKKFLTVAIAAVVLAVGGNFAYAAVTASTGPKVNLCVAKAKGYNSTLKYSYQIGQARVATKCYSFEKSVAVEGYVAPTPVEHTFSTTTGPGNYSGTIIDVPAGKTVTFTGFSTTGGALNGCDISDDTNGMMGIVVGEKTATGFSGLAAPDVAGSEHSFVGNSDGSSKFHWYISCGEQSTENPTPAISFTVEYTIV